MTEVFKDCFLPAVEQARKTGEARLVPMLERLSGDPAVHQIESSVVPEYTLASLFLDRAGAGDLVVAVRFDPNSGDMWYVLQKRA